MHIDSLCECDCFINGRCTFTQEADECAGGHAVFCIGVGSAAFSDAGKRNIFGISHIAFDVHALFIHDIDSEEEQRQCVNLFDAEFLRFVKVGAAEREICQADGFEEARNCSADDIRRFIRYIEIHGASDDCVAIGQDFCDCRAAVFAEALCIKRQTLLVIDFSKDGQLDDLSG